MSNAAALALYHKLRKDTLLFPMFELDYLEYELYY